jgi:predicted kinase
MKPTVYLMLGLTGSGKSTFSKKLTRELGIERFAFDSEYERLGGDLSDHRWNKDVEEKTFNVMKHWMTQQLKENRSIILDYCPWVRSDRDSFRTLIESLGGQPHIYYFDVAPSELWSRLSKRNKTDKESQYVTKDMLNDFIKRFEPPSSEEFELVKE